MNKIKTIKLGDARERVNENKIVDTRFCITK